MTFTRTCVLLRAFYSLGIQPFEVQILADALENPIIDPASRRLPDDIGEVEMSMSEELAAICVERQERGDPPCAGFSHADLHDFLPRATWTDGGSNFARYRSEIENAARLLFSTRTRCVCP